MSKGNGKIETGKDEVNSLDDLLAINDKVVVRHFCAGWNKVVFLRRLTMKAHALLERFLFSLEDGVKVGSAPYFRETVVGLAMCNSEGKAILDSLEACKKLADMDSGTIKELFEVADKLNAITDGSKEALKKKSETIPAS